MRNLALWLIICIAITTLFRHRLYIPTILAVLTFVAVPGQAEGLIMPQLHPGAWFLLVLLPFYLSVDWPAYRDILLRTQVVVVAMLALTAYTSLDLINPSGGSSLYQWFGFVLRQMGFPYLIYTMLRAELARTRRAEPVILWSLFLMGLAQVYLSFLQVSTDGKQGYLWKAYYVRSWWWVDNWHIGMGTTAHPLQMGIFLAALIPLLSRLRWQSAAFGIGLAYLYGIASATARTATVLAGAAFVYVFIRGSRAMLRMALVLLLAVPFALTLYRSHAVTVLLAKFRSDGGSTQLRGDALKWVLAHHNEFLVFGYPGSRDLRSAGVLSSSLENAYLMAGLSFGLIFAAALILFHLGMVLAPLRHFRPDLIGYFLAAAFTMIAFNGSSSFMVGGLEGTTFWVFLALYHAAAYGPPPPEIAGDADGVGALDGAEEPADPATSLPWAPAR